MIWRRGEKGVTLEQADLQVMKLCNIPMEEVLRANVGNHQLPPLWSVLSYAMLISGGSADGIMSTYRQVQEMAKNTAVFYHRESILKADGGVRWLFVPRYSLREHQNRILCCILEKLPVDPHAYAYRRGVSFRDCAEPHVGKAVLIHMDLKNFFGTVKEDMVFAAFLRETGYPPGLCRFFARLCCLYGALPQGTATSPALSNIVFRPCDEALAKLAERFGLDYTRYSDDLFFSGGESVDPGQVIPAVTDCLEGFGFFVNKEKTRVRRRQHRQSVLGLTVNEGIKVTREYRRQLERELYYLERFGEAAAGAKEAESYLRYMQKLLGKVNYVLQIDPGNEKWCKLRRSLQNKISRHEYELHKKWLLTLRLEEEIHRINNLHGLQICTREIRRVYGEDLLMKLAENASDTLANIRCLIQMGFGADVSAICNLYGYLLYEDSGAFLWKVRDLAETLGDDYVAILHRKLSLWDKLL